MASFILNEVEKENQKAIIDSIKVLCGEDIEYNIQYIVVYSGIGVKVEIIVSSKKRVFMPIRKDITDYDCW
jgi:hypothetical protein